MRWWLAAIQPAESALRMVASLDEDHHTVQILLDESRAVQVDDLAQVLDHRIARIVGSTSQVVRFIGGGELRYAHNSRGQVIELSSSGVRASVSRERVVKFIAPDGSGRGGDAAKGRRSGIDGRSGRQPAISCLARAFDFRFVIIDMFLHCGHHEPW